MTIEINGVEHTTQEQIAGVIENLRAGLRDAAAATVSREASIAFRHLYELYLEADGDATDAVDNARTDVSAALGKVTGLYDDESLTFTADED